MSRICGIIDSLAERVKLESELVALVAPMLHSPDFATDSRINPPAALARVFFGAHNFSTHVAELKLHGATCFFTGYLRDLSELAERVRRESHGDVTGTNPAEVLGWLVLRNGHSVLPDLNGSFVFALWTEDNRTLQLGTDRWGTSSLYYRHAGRRLSFATEIKALLSLESEPNLDFGAVQEVFSIGTPIGDHTLYSSIHRLPPASVLTFRDGAVSINRYWWYQQTSTPGPADLTDFIVEMRRRFSHSMSKLLAQVDRPICMLSAGYDSRRILLEMVAQGVSPVAYTAPIIQPTGGYEVETSIAGALCREFGIPHVHVELPSPQEQAAQVRLTYQMLDFESDAHAWIVPLLAKIPTASGVNFDGIGGDVLEDGNFTQVEHAAHLNDPLWLANSVVARFPDFWSSHFSLPAPNPTLSERIAAEIMKLPVFDHRYTIFYFTNWTRRKTALFCHRLISLKLDSVFPFLDYDVVDLLLSVPPLWKRENKIRPAFLRHVNTDLMDRYPSSHTTDIFAKPELQWQHFCHALAPDYLPRARAALYRSTGVDIMRSPETWGQISGHARMAVLSSAMPATSLGATEWLTRRAWPLRLLGLFALQRRTAAHPALSQKLNAELSRYVYAAPEARSLAEPVARID